MNPIDANGPIDQEQDQKHILRGLFKAGDANRYLSQLLKIQKQGLDPVSWIRNDSLAPDWEAFTAYAVDQRKEESQGYVFLVCHQSQPNWFRIGRTKFSPYTRLKQLEQEVGHPITLLNAWPVFDRIYFYRLIEERVSNYPQLSTGTFRIGDTSSVTRVIQATLEAEYTQLRPLNQIALLAPPPSRRVARKSALATPFTPLTMATS